MSEIMEAAALQFEKLDEVKMLEHKSQLDILEHISTYINSLRESLTRELIVNDVKSDEDLKKKIENVTVKKSDDLDLPGLGFIP